MKIEVRASNLTVSEALEAHILRKLDFALRRFAAGVDRVVVRLVDLNGPKGGLDKRCRIAAHLSAPAPSVIVEAVDADTYVAVSQAAARLDARVAHARGRLPHRRLAKLAPVTSDHESSHRQARSHP
jgi:ribosomal subunit interface protein